MQSNYWPTEIPCRVMNTSMLQLTNIKIQAAHFNSLDVRDINQRICCINNHYNIKSTIEYLLRYVIHIHKTNWHSNLSPVLGLETAILVEV